MGSDYSRVTAPWTYGYSGAKFDTFEAMHTIQVVYFEAGGGHVTAARALAEVLRRDAALTVELVNLQELLDTIDPIQKTTGIRLQDWYNLCMAREWTWGMGHIVPALQGLIRWRQRAIVNRLCDFWRARPADFVVSVIPHFNPALREALRRELPRTPMMVVLTDLSDTEPSFWLTGKPDVVVCGSERAVAQARERGFAPEHILPASGMILRPMFYEVAGVDRVEGRRALGLAPDLPTGLVLLGGMGGARLKTIAASLEAVTSPVQLIYVCGRDERTAAVLRQGRSRHPRWVEGFTDQVQKFMGLADFFIGKPGPGSLSEALHMGLPAVVACNRRTLPQERFNAAWLVDNGYGLVLRHYHEVGGAVEQLLRPNVLPAYRARIQGLHNRAVFEIAEAIRRRLPRALAVESEVDRNHGVDRDRSAVQ